MATAMKKCKVCGTEYEYCRSVRRIADVFRWQDVACSPEHGSIYFARVAAARAAEDAEVVENHDYISELIDDEDDELFEEDFDDNEAE